MYVCILYILSQLWSRWSMVIYISDIWQQILASVYCDGALLLSGAAWQYLTFCQVNVWGSLNFLKILIFILHLSAMFNADFSGALGGVAKTLFW